jgi:hypothetical protein
MSFILPLDRVIEHAADAGQRMLTGEELTHTDRIVGSFAVALLMWMADHEREALEEYAEALSDEMYKTEDNLQ